MTHSITNLVGEDLGGDSKWKGTLAAPNGSVYAIPARARRVVKFNPVDKTITHIGPDFGGGERKWYRGAMTGSGVIYCPPLNEERGILKIDTNTDTVTELNVNLLPERGYYMWISCAVALDGCIYFMPCTAHRIMKLDPNNSDAMSSVGDVLGDDDEKYNGTVVGIDGCVYGIPECADVIPKYDPINDITSFVGEEAEMYFWCTGNGDLGRDGCIYALTQHGRVLKIDTVNNSYCFVGKSIQIDNDFDYGWMDGILGIDGCIYWPPDFASRTLKYDPHTDQISLVCCDLGTKRSKWLSGALTPGGIIYCISSCNKRVLAIDPWGEFLETTKVNMEAHPDKFGFLFQKITEVGEDSTLHESQTKFDHAIAKFGQKQVFEVLDKSMEPVNVYCKETNLCPFMIVASYKETSALSAINYLLRRDLSWVNNCITCSICSLEGNTSTHKKRKLTSVK